MSGLYSAIGQHLFGGQNEVEGADGPNLRREAEANWIMRSTLLFITSISFNILTSYYIVFITSIESRRPHVYVANSLQQLTKSASSLRQSP